MLSTCRSTMPPVSFIGPSLLQSECPVDQGGEIRWLAALRVRHHHHRWRTLALYAFEFVVVDTAGAARPDQDQRSVLARRRQRFARLVRARRDGAQARQPVARARSEEHTSELQSLRRISYAVFCLK